jgi:hypothetical protein
MYHFGTAALCYSAIYVLLELLGYSGCSSQPALSLGVPSTCIPHCVALSPPADHIKGDPNGDHGLCCLWSGLWGLQLDPEGGRTLSSGQCSSAGGPARRSLPAAGIWSSRRFGGSRLAHSSMPAQSLLVDTPYEAQMLLSGSSAPRQCIRYLSHCGSAAV